MSKAIKINILMLITQIQNKVVRQMLGSMSQQSWSNKRKRDSFTADDLIIVAQATGTTLAFVNPTTKQPIVTLELEDLTKHNLEVFHQSWPESKSDPQTKRVKLPN